jgi:gliding motility-associated-like protein
MLDKKIKLILIILLSYSPNLWAQFSLNISNNDTSIGCTNNCIPVSFTHPNLKSTSSYSVATIPYQSITLPSPTPIALQDDLYSNPIPIGFNFCFYGTNYNSCIVGSNGLLAFNTLFANTFCYNNTAIQFPFTSGTLPNQVIAMPFIDLDPSQSGGVIQYQTIGVAPNRKFIVQFVNVILFGNTSNVSNSFYTVLTETTNEIEIFVGNKGVLNSTNPTSLDSAVLGVQNHSTLSFTCPPNKNGGVWTASNEAWKFTPDGLNNFTTTWKLNGTTLLNKISGDTICFPNTPSNKLVITYTNLCPVFELKDSFIVTKLVPKIDSLTVTQPTCKYDKGTIKINASSSFPPLTYNVNFGFFIPNNIFQNLPVVQVDYTLTVKDASGCITSILYDLNPISNLNATPNVVGATCNNSDGVACINLGGGVIPYSFLWSNGVTTLCNSNIPGNTILSVVATDAVGCVDSELVFVQKILPTIITDSIIKPDCPSGLGSIHIKGALGVAPYTYNWINAGGAITPSIFNLPGNVTYSVVVTDATGCSSQIPITLEYKKLLNFNFTFVKPSCKKSNGSITAIPINGTAPYTYNWNGGGTSATKSNISSGGHILFASDANGCKGDTIIGIGDTLVMVLGKSKINTKCGYNNGSISIAPSQGMAPYNYSWLPSGMNSPINANISPGTYFCTVTDALQCIKIDTTFIDSSKKINLVMNNKNPYCDSANGIALVTPSNGTAPYSYNWFSGPTDSSWSNLSPGSYTVEVTDATNCTIQTIALLNDNGTPKLSVLTYKPPICFGDSNGVIQLIGNNGSSPYKYSYDGINFSTTSLINNISGGTYIFYIQDASSCTIDTTINLFKPTPIILTYGKIDSLICFGDKLPNLNYTVLGGYTPYLYSFDNGNFSNSASLINLSSGLHSLTIKDTNNCIKAFPFNIPGPQKALELIIKKKNVDCLQLFTGVIDATINGGWGNYSFNWNTGDTKLKLDSINAGEYELSVKDALGCATNSIITLIRDSCCIAKVATAFSPNQDGKNEELSIMSFTPISEVELNIFNRYGERVFNTKDINNRWDGKYKTEYCDMGTYFYVLKYKCSYSKEEFIFKGDIELLK